MIIFFPRSSPILSTCLFHSLSFGLCSFSDLLSVVLVIVSVDSYISMIF